MLIGASAVREKSYNTRSDCRTSKHDVKLETRTYMIWSWWLVSIVHKGINGNYSLYIILLHLLNMLMSGLVLLFTISQSLFRNLLEMNQMITMYIDKLHKSC